MRCGLFLMTMVLSIVVNGYSKQALVMLKDSEKFSATVYKCQAGVPTIGYGFTEKKYVSLGSMNQRDAEKVLIEKIEKIEVLIDKVVKKKLTSNQKAALISLIYNIGENSFLKSKLLKKLNEGKTGIVIEKSILVWNKVKSKGRLIVSKGLALRRQKELNVWKGYV